MFQQYRRARRAHSRGRTTNLTSSRIGTVGPASFETLEDRRLLSVGVQADTPFRMIGITGNQQSDLTRFEDETLWDIKLAGPDSTPTQFLDGFEDITSNPPDTVLTTQGDIGVTQGSGALRVDVPQTPAPFWGFRSPNIVDLLAAGATTLSYDETFINKELNGGSFGAAGDPDNSFNGYAQSNELAVVIAAPSGGFIQRNFTTGGATDDTGQNGQWNGIDGTHHITWDLTQFTAGTADAPVSLADFIAANNATDARIWFVTQGQDTNGHQGPMRFYFDNIVISKDQDPGAFKTFVGDFDPVSTTKLVHLPFVPDTDTIGYNPDNGLLYRTSGSSSYRDDPNKIGYNDNQFMETVDVNSPDLTQTGVFNANYEGDGGTGPYGLPAPRPSFVLPAERRTPDQTDPAIGDEVGPGEYEALRDMAWSSTEHVFYGADTRGIFKLTPAGQSTFVGKPIVGAGGPKGLTFFTVGGERRLLLSERDGSNLWTIDPATGQTVGDPVMLNDAKTSLEVKGILALEEGPDGVLYGISHGQSPFMRELVKIDPETGAVTSIGALGAHFAGLAALPAAATPSVASVYVRGTAWSQGFKDFLAAKGLGDATYGFRADNLPADTTLPWINTNQVVLHYGAPVSPAGVPAPGSVVLHGTLSDYTVTAVTQLDAQTFALTLDRALGIQPPPATDPTQGDRVTLTVPGAGAAGGNYTTTLAVLQGDADRNQKRVTAVDLGFVKARANTSSADTATTGAVYTAFADLNGSGRIDAIDLGAAKARINDALPAATTTLSPLALSSIASDLFGTGRILD